MAEASQPRPSLPAPGAAALARLRKGLPGRWASWAYGLLLTLAYALATVALTWPYAARAADSLPPEVDPPLQVWIMRWVQHALATDPRHLYDANIFWPLDKTLAYSDSNVPTALLAAPAYLLTRNALLAYNLMVLGSFVLAAVGMDLLVIHLTRNRAAGFLAGLAYAFLPYRYDHIWHLNQLAHAWTPLVALALLILLERQTWRAALGFGLLLAVQVASSFYVGFQVVLVLALAVPVALVADRRARTRRCVGRLAAGGALAAALVLPLVLPYAQVRAEQGFVRSLGEAAAASATPASYLKVSRNDRVWGWLNPEHILGGEDTLFPGGLAVLGAVGGVAAGLRRRRALTAALLAIGAAAFALSLGPTWQARRGGTTPLPYRWLFAHVPFFSSMRYPARFGVLVDGVVVVLAGLGAAATWGWLAPRLPRGRAGAAGLLLTGVLAALLVVELDAAPIRLARVDDDPALATAERWLARQPDPGAVMYFPTTATDRTDTVREMYWSTLDWRPLVYGYSGFTPPAEDAYLQAFVGDLRRQDGTVARRVTFVDAADVGLLQDLGVRYLVVERYGYKREDWAAVLAQLAAARPAVAEVADFGDQYVLYRVQPASARPPDIELTAPPTAAPGGAWAPDLRVDNPAGRPALLSRGAFRLSTLTVVWRDTRGRVVDQSRASVAAPLVVPAGDLTVPLPADPAPRAVGRYTVALTLAGGLDLRATESVDVGAGQRP